MDLAPRQSRRVIQESTGTADRDKAEKILRERLAARDEGTLSGLLSGRSLAFNNWAGWFLENRSRPPIRAEKTHQANLEVLTQIRPVFGKLALSEITSELIEEYLAKRLRSRRTIKSKLKTYEKGTLKPSTVHREYRVLNRILNVAVQKRRIVANPCQAVDFPVRLAGSTRKPHYLTATEQERIELLASSYLRNVVVIMVEMGLRPYRELLPMRKEQVDLSNHFVHLPDSKTPSGIADMPMTERAHQAFADQMRESEGSEYLFPSSNPTSVKPHLRNIRRGWNATLRRARIEHFSLYELRRTFVTRLSAGGVADHFVTQLLRQGDSAVFKRYSQAKLKMMREALEKLDRGAAEHAGTSVTV